MPEPIRNLQPLSLDEIAALAGAEKRPPLDKWNPPLSGHSRILIARDGSWFHDGTLITRENLVRLFANILRREPDGSYVLVTPVERQTVDVEDAPFVAVEVKTDGMGEQRTLALRTSIGDMVVVGPDHPLSFEAKDGQPAPRVLVRAGLEASISRAVFYELVELAIHEAGEPLGLWSGGTFFSMAALA